MTQIIGLDVSRHQNKFKDCIDWSIAKQRGVVFGAARATVGDYYKDPSFRANWEGMKANGIYRTAYHVVRPDYSVSKQIDLLFEALQGDIADLPLVLDVEVVGPGTGPFDPTDVNKAVKQCANLIRAKDGCWPIIYTAGWYANTYLGTLDDRAYLKEFEVWLAQYNTYIDEPDPVYPWNGDWDIWQFSADGNMRGAEFGAESRDIDIDLYNGPIDKFLNDFGLQDIQDPDPEPTDPTIPANALMKTSGDFDIIADEMISRLGLAKK